MRAAGIQLRLYGASAELVKVIFDLGPLHPLFAVTVQKTIGNNHIKFWLFMQKCNNNKVIFLRVSLVYFKYACMYSCGAITQIRNDFVLFVISSFFPEKKVVAGFSDDVTQDWTNSRLYSKRSH